MSPRGIKAPVSARGLTGARVSIPCACVRACVCKHKEFVAPSVINMPACDAAARAEGGKTSVTGGALRNVPERSCVS